MVQTCISKSLEMITNGSETQVMTILMTGNWLKCWLRYKRMMEYHLMTKITVNKFYDSNL